MLKSIIKNMDKNDLSLEENIGKAVLEYFTTYDNAIKHYKAKAKSSISITFQNPNDYFKKFIKEETNTKLKKIIEEIKELKKDSNENIYTLDELRLSIIRTLGHIIGFDEEADKDFENTNKCIYKFSILNTSYEYAIGIIYNKEDSTAHIKYAKLELEDLK